jgi:LysM repeat protein
MLAASSVASAYRYQHEVLPGETLVEISKRYRIPVAKLKRLNRLRSHQLRMGRKLKVVTSVPVRQRRRVAYHVRKRDSIGKIAKKYKMKLSLLRRLNRNLSSRSLRVGRKLWVVEEGPMPSGVARGMHELKDGPGYNVRWGHRSWGTTVALTTIQDIFAGYKRRFPEAKDVKIWDLSIKGGGRFGPHQSHRSGRDADIPYVLKPAYTKKIYATSKTIDLKRSWYLLKSFIKSKNVKYIFVDYRLQKLLYTYALKIGEPEAFVEEAFQYPNGRRKMMGIIRHSSGHASHYHVRFHQERDRKEKPTS